VRSRHLLVPALSVALLAGCTISSPATSNGAKPTDVAPSASIALDAGTVVATGRLTSVDGLTSGDVTVQADGSRQFEYRITDLTTPVTDTVSINFSTQPFTEEAYCAGGFTILSKEQFDLAGRSIVSDTDWYDLMLVGPDYLDTLVLTSSTGDTPKTGCFYPVIATAPLTWTLPDPRPDIVVVDGGATGGAMGPVAQADGEPATYEVVADDQLPEIAARFGITLQDLHYLNPARSPSPLDPVAYVGELFNLSKSGR